jgi:hypothetical protein
VNIITNQVICSRSNHFKNLLGKKANLPDDQTLPSVNITDTLNIRTSNFVTTELKSAVKQLKASKAFGPDNIPALIWKDTLFHNVLLGLCNHTLNTNQSPKVWHQSQIIPMPKKGDLSLATNYRGISLMPIAAKIYNKMILNRLIPHVEPLLRDNQNGFRKGRSTLSQVLCLRRIIEESQSCNLDLAIVFVDFSKAFDSVDRDKMFEILELYGIPSKLIAAIRVLYTDTCSTILTPDGKTSPFQIQAGILQGDTLAPFLFIIVVDYVLRMSVDTINSKGYQLKERVSSRHPAKYLTDTDFTDGIALMSQSLADADSLLQSLEKASNSVDRDNIFEILELYGIPSKLIADIRVLYTDTRSTILTPDGKTSPFQIQAGILQGDTLAPFLFIIVVDYVLRMSVDTINSKGYQLKERVSSRHPAKYLTDTDFTDGIALMSQSLADADSLLQSLEKASNSVDRDNIFEILELYGIPSKLIADIRVLYTDTRSTILTPDGKTSPFQIQAGILQGDNLALFLFIVVLRMSVDTITSKGY